jgi:hypothetical protein
VKLVAKYTSYFFEDWITVFLPKEWIVEIDEEEEDLLNIYSEVNPKGVMQISFFTKSNNLIDNYELALHHLDDFISQFNVDIDKDKDTYMTLQANDIVYALTNGIMDNRFIKIWVIVDDRRMLLATYISEKKTRELNIVDDIIYGIEFDNSKTILN